MSRHNRITRMDEWDIPAGQLRLKGGCVPLCDIVPHPAMHQLGSLVYFSQYRRTKTGIPFTEIKDSEEIAMSFAEDAVSLVNKLVNNLVGWCLITTPRRRHAEGFHFASEACAHISRKLGIPFHEGAVQCINRKRIEPEFHLLRTFEERNVIVYDDIITTGSTLTATASLLCDRDLVLNLIGINNR